MRDPLAIIELVKILQFEQLSFERLLKQALLHRAYVAKLPVADIKKNVDFKFRDPVKSMSPDEEFYDRKALLEAIKSFKPQFHVMGKCGRAGRRWVGTIHCGFDQRILDQIEHINKLKRDLADAVLFDDDDDGSKKRNTRLKRTMKARRTLWRKVLPQGQIPLTVTRQLVAVTDIKSLSYHWMDKGISSESISYEDAKQLLTRYVSERFIFLTQDNDKYLERKLALIDLHDREKLRIIRPIKLYPCYKFNKRVYHAHTPIIVVQDEPLQRYCTLSKYNLDECYNTKNSISKNYFAISPEVHLYADIRI
ncbi:DNA replication terminus site-binding protein [Photobacterium kishitanii]|uniref:DNA replication terminus site-binding protein n=1 Tax=Photobacterium kishitanii TaxID=318456 RepID=UPI0007F8F3F9|nr:DNA replication terminus site-binding protein [Photobacterium kishitanii]OBU31191.1 hypothetical protein AYY23_19970 [Photobacterium kishitanii]PSW46900.1 hypothetical protein C0W66_21175 [Photobacterium kishitanii]